MEPEARYTLVGTLVLLLFGALLVAIFWLARIGPRENAERYLIYFKHQTLEGLQPNSDVRMKGIKVGSVAEYGIPRSQIESVRVVIRTSADTPVKQSTAALIRRNLLTGLAYIDLVNSTQDSPALTTIPEGETAPVIAEGQNSLEVVADTLPQLARDVGEVVTRLNAVLSPQNQQSLSSTLSNVSQLTGDLTRRNSDIDQVVGDLRDVAARVRTLSGAVTDATRTLNRDLSAVTTETVATLKEVRKGVAALNRSGDAVAQQVQGVSDASLIEFANLARDIQSSSAKLTATLDRFQDPQALLFGPSAKRLGPGEKVR